MAYDGPQACAPCLTYKYALHTLTARHIAPCSLHPAPLCLCLGLCSIATPVQPSSIPCISHSATVPYLFTLRRYPLSQS